jgi:signal transduction histidine kinase
VPRFQSRVSGVTLLAAAVLVLLPALAWLQYSWLDQIADADRERRERTLQTAASQLAQDFDGELGKAVFGLQLEPSIVEQQAWGSYAARYQLWAESALTPDLVRAVYFVAVAPDRSQAAEPPLRVWNQRTHTFDETPWPDELAAIRTRFIHDSHTIVNLQMPAPRRGDRGGQRILLPPTPTGDEQSIIVPIMRITPVATSGAIPQGPPDVKLLGFTIIRLDLTALGKEVLPALVRRHLFDDAGRTDFLIAVVAREQPSRVIFESEPGAAAAATERPDAAVSMLGTRMGPFMFMTRDARRVGPGEIAREAPGTPARQTPPPAPPPAPRPAENTEKVVVSVVEARRNDGVATMQTRGFAGGAEGHWRLVAKHRAGSLEAAVSSARTRNFVLSSGILLLLATAIGLIVVSARRADRLARQQLEFVAAVSHELRTPVSVIGAAAGNLADGVVEEPGRVKKYGVTIQTEARRLAETVERVLQLAGIASGRASAAGGSIAVADLIRDAVAASRHEIDHAGAVVEVEIAPELLNYPTDPSGVQRVAGDATALRSAIHNLISNAIKYGGEARWVRVSARPTSHRATQITVEDRGLGIAAEDRKHIFEPFYRGREAVSRQIQGSGLGLHLVRRIIEAHGGTVSVHSEPGHGSTFTIELPGLHDVPTRRTSGRSSAFARIFGGRRTLGADGPAG